MIIIKTKYGIYKFKNVKKYNNNDGIKKFYLIAINHKVNIFINYREETCDELMSFSSEKERDLIYNKIIKEIGFNERIIDTEIKEN